MARETIEGDVVSVLYAKQETGWTVFDLRESQGRNVRVTGVAPGVCEGERVRAHGQWTETQYGRQFKSYEIHLFPPSSVDGLRAFLGSGAIDGMGAGYARRLVDAYGEDLISILDERPAEIEQVRGIGPERRRRISEAWNKHKGVRDVMMFLAEHGISAAKAKRIHERFGDAAVGVLRGDPYKLTEINGFGFLTADGIAGKMGVKKEAPERLRAGIVHVLETASLYGHCGMRESDALGAAADLLRSDSERTGMALADLVEHDRVCREQVGDATILLLPRLAHSELEIAARLSAMSARRPHWCRGTHKEIQEVVERAQAACGIRLSASQRIAVSMAICNNVLLITGGPGCGKTTTTRVVLEALAGLGAQIALAAPTGRAAKRLSEVTGRDATTIHRLVGRSINEPRSIEASLVLIDEASMVDVELMMRLMRGLRENAALMLVGDADQLESVGPGRVFGDLIDTGRVPTATLTEVHRQAAGSPIVRVAHEVREGRVPRLAATGECVGMPVRSRDDIAVVIEDLMKRVLPDHYGLDVMTDVQVLTPMRKGPAGSIALNTRLQGLLNPNACHGVTWGGQLFAVGDRVLQTENDYDRCVFNGDTGTIIAIDAEAGIMEVGFDQRVVRYGRNETDSLLLAYAMTVHKAQGSEFRAVVVAIAREHFKLLSRKLLYTALTRGKQYEFVVFEEGAMELAVRTNTAERITSLRDRVMRVWDSARARDPQSSIASTAALNPRPDPTAWSRW